MYLNRDLLTERHGHYKVGPRFAGLQQGRVCIGLDLDTDVGVAVKVERINKKDGHLTQEILAYDAIWSTKMPKTGIPCFMFGGTLGRHRYVVLDRLGRNLEQLRIECGGTLSLKSVLMVGMRALNAIKSIHNAGLVHCRIEPRNLLMGRYVHDEATVYVIDYKHAKRYYGAQPRDDEIPFSVGIASQEVTPFTSIAHDNGIALGRKHDLESLGYTLLYLYYGQLPWQVEESLSAYSCLAKGRSTDSEIGMMSKKKTDVFRQCSGLPYEIERFFLYVKALGTNSKPNYDLLSCLFENAFFRSGAADDCTYDWTPSFEKFPA